MVIQNEFAMNKHIYAVFGASGFGREVMPLARDIVGDLGVDSHDIIFVDDSPISNKINGHHVYTYDEFVLMAADSKSVVVAISDTKIRKEITNRCLSDNINLWNVNSSSVVIMDDVEVGVGSILSPYVTITSNVRIGKSFHANLYSYVAHDCIIGDYVTFAPGVKCNGNVVIEDNVYVATGAIIRQGRPGRPLVIGEGSIVGMGAVVTKNVPPGQTVIGNPAAPLTRKKLRA